MIIALLAFFLNPIQKAVEELTKEIVDGIADSLVSVIYLIHPLIVNWVLTPMTLPRLSFLRAGLLQS